MTKENTIKRRKGCNKGKTKKNEKNNNRLWYEIPNKKNETNKQEYVGREETKRKKIGT